jgi:hypothetical protein
MLDEQHLVATSDHPRRQAQFAGELGQFMQSLRDVQLCPLYGRFITDMESFCHQLERALPGPALERRIEGPRGITNLLRSREAGPRRRTPKFRYYLWHDADVLIEHDESLFGRLVDTIAGVGAESEFVSDDLLLIHRLVAVGGTPLSLYAQRESGQCRSWHDDGLGCGGLGGEPFWEVVTGLERPAFQTLAIDSLIM